LELGPARQSGDFGQYGRMSVLLAINRDFPFQVPLSFDEAAMEVLNWLENPKAPAVKREAEEDWR
jgi:hypothetical protein